MVLFGGLLWANLVGTFCGLAAAIDPDTREKRDRLSTLIAFMHDAGLPRFLRYRLREYIFEANEAFKDHKARVLMDLFSPVKMRGLI